MTLPSFCEERFPLRVAFGTSGGPERVTEIVRLSTGFETRNQRHRHSARRYDAGSGLRSLEDLAAVLAFFEARRGRLIGFRFRDPLDWCSGAPGRAVSALDQAIGIGDGQARAFALLKRYGTGEDAYLRPVQKPVAGTVRVAAGGVEVPFALDTATGVVTLDEAPAEGVGVTAGFEFDVPVRFDIDHLAVNIAAFEAGDIPSIPLVEVRP
ncbi:DUF2460 domain-containing protein [Aureimonas populi]|uniref:TIGR02217 family protein n=1 Tax=Aureimonas populi TaxID=1701758 RepID=A0ABW5CIC3_9HYPH|nr:DUF2460 domain-containing protein [Aureimonas populi]